MKIDAMRSTPSLAVISSDNQLKKTSLTYKIVRIAKMFFQCLLSPLFLGLSLCRSLRERFVEPTEQQIKDWQEKLNQNGLALEQAPYWVKKNEALVKTAILNNPDAVKHCNSLLLYNDLFVGDVLSEWKQEISGQKKIIPSELLQGGNGSYVLMKVLRENPDLINSLSNETRIKYIFFDFSRIERGMGNSHLASLPLNLKQSRAFWLTLFNQGGVFDSDGYKKLWECAVKDQFFCKSVYTQQWFWENILATCIKTLEFNRSKAASHPDFFKKRMEEYSILLKNLSNKIPNYLNLLQMALDYEPNSFQYLGEDLRKDPKAILLALKKSTTNLQYVPLEKQDRDSVNALLEKNPPAFDSILDLLKNRIRADLSQNKSDTSEVK